jgi:hypothetical protein
MVGSHKVVTDIASLPLPANFPWVLSIMDGRLASACGGGVDTSSGASLQGTNVEE